MIIFTVTLDFSEILRISRCMNISSALEIVLQKAKGTKTNEETSGCVKPEQVNMWLNSLIAT
jgi:hypothetical protein